MKFTIERKRLLDACKKVMRVTAPSSNNDSPALSGILLEADADSRTIKLTGTNLNVSMMLKLKDVDVSDSGDAVIPASLITAMLGAMTDETAAVVINGTTLSLQCGSSYFHTMVMSAEQFPVVEIAYPENTICVSGLSLISKQTATIANESSENQSFRGVKVKFSSNETTASSTDGIRFAKSKGENIADGELDVFIPERSLKLICGIIKANESVYIGKTESSIVFMTETIVFTTTQLNGNLDKIEKAVQQFAPKYKATVDASELYRAIDSCMVMLHNADLCVNLTMADKTLMLSVNNENGDTDVGVTAQSATDMEGIVFHYNPKLILDFVKSCTGTVAVEIAETGILKLISGITVYVISARRAARIKEKKPADDTDKTGTTNKAKKGKTAKKAAA